VYFDCNFAHLYVILCENVKREHLESGRRKRKVYGFEPELVKKEEDDIGVQNPLAGPSEGVAF